MLQIQQGWRRRHPNRVLHQFDGVSQQQSKAKTLFEQALLHETKRSSLPKEYRPNDDADGMANQMGLVTTALDNYKGSKEKLSRMYLSSV